MQALAVVLGIAAGQQLLAMRRDLLQTLFPETRSKAVQPTTQDASLHCHKCESSHPRCVLMSFEWKRGRHSLAAVHGATLACTGFYMAACERARLSREGTS